MSFRDWFETRIDTWNKMDKYVDPWTYKYGITRWKNHVSISLYGFSIRYLNFSYLFLLLLADPLKTITRAIKSLLYEKNIDSSGSWNPNVRNKNEKKIDKSSWLDRD